MHEEKSPELIAEHTERLRQLKALMGCNSCAIQNPDELEWYPDEYPTFWENPNADIPRTVWYMVMAAVRNSHLYCIRCYRSHIAEAARCAATQARWDAEIKRNPRGRR